MAIEIMAMNKGLADARVATMVDLKAGERPAHRFELPPTHWVHRAHRSMWLYVGAAILAVAIILAIILL